MVEGMPCMAINEVNTCVIKFHLYNNIHIKLKFQDTEI